MSVRPEPLPEALAAPAALLARPAWIKARAPAGERYERLRGLMRDLDLHTVCEEAHTISA